MMKSRPVFVFFLSFAWLSPPATAQFDHEFMRYDTPDETIKAHVLDDPNLYDADIASIDGQLWVTCLKFVPGKGDQLLLGKIVNGRCVQPESLIDQPRMITHPTFLHTKPDRINVSFEDAGKPDPSGKNEWNISIARPMGANPPHKYTRSVGGRAPAINHRVTHDGSGQGYLVCQEMSDHTFSIKLRPFDRKNLSNTMSLVHDAPASEWHPDVAVAADGTVCVVYDAYDGDSYNTYAWIAKDGKQGHSFKVAGTPAFEGRARVAANSKGRFWVVWEQGAENWGKRYTARMRLKSPKYFEMTDTNGPLHRFRRLHVAVIEPDGTVRKLKTPLPMPSFDQARQRPNSPEGSKQLGVFYERAAITVDASDKVWVVYRHYYVPYLGCEWITHNQSPWGVYARCLTSAGWSKLHRFDVGQGDGMQRLEITPQGRHGIAAVWTTGRTHRSGRAPSNLPRGIAIATVSVEAEPPGDDLLAERRDPRKTFKQASIQSAKPPKAVVGDKEYELVFGDLHRHTDLSLCFVPADGTMDDHYRYAIDVAPLDFMGITDHARDIADGDALSQLWWRCTKEVSRHDLGSRFIPFSAYERSRGGEDHNVISLGIAPLRPYTYPHPEFWKELDDKTITIPHQTRTAEITDPANPPWAIQADTWKVRDDLHRPLIEVYQACRDRWIGMDAHVGLRKGHHLGFIASSDHLATSASYACVWTPERTREAIFRSMQSRRTFAATDKIRLILRAGDHWMGEQIKATAMPRIDFEVDGTAPLKSIEVVVDGKVEQRLPQSRQKAKLTYQPRVTEPGEHWIYVRAIQEDGNQAWSSPLFVEIQK